MGTPGLLLDDTERDLPQRIAEVESRVQAWWLKFSEDIFPLLVPRSTWKRKQPPLAAGAIVLVKYESKFGKDRFRLGRVVDVKVYQDRLVRTAWVGIRALRRVVREPLDVCRSGLSLRELPVQRLVLGLPPEEQPPEVLEGLAGFHSMPGKGGREAQAEAGPEREARGLEPVVVQVEPQPEEEIVDLPLPQRAPPARGRPRRS